MTLDEIFSTELAELSVLYGWRVPLGVGFYHSCPSLVSFCCHKDKDNDKEEVMIPAYRNLPTSVLSSFGVLWHTNDQCVS
jgi:hypothetical protein|mmetsp:Transcript_17111/g.27890  ORF Transcript_17111/g.27890 Transcript_17111/m.27890 type:complete len:80 (-) Transcript_17111:696-935(-)